MTGEPNIPSREQAGLPLDLVLLERRDDILRTALRHGALNVRVFGSTGRGETTDTSDKTSPWFPAGLVTELEELLGRRVEVVTEAGLNWLLRRRILKEARPL